MPPVIGKDVHEYPSALYFIVAPLVAPVPDAQNTLLRTCRLFTPVVKEPVIPDPEKVIPSPETKIVLLVVLLPPTTIVFVAPLYTRVFKVVPVNPVTVQPVQFNPSVLVITLFDPHANQALYESIKITAEAFDRGLFV
jgi:hypothetical protein